MALLALTQPLAPCHAAVRHVLVHAGEKCDPYIYYQRVRQPMSGWRNNPQLPQVRAQTAVSCDIA